MKKSTFKLLFIVLFAVISSNIFAQNKIDIIPFYGWQMNGKVKFHQGELKTDDNPLFGVAMDVYIAPDMAVRLMYSRTETDSHFRNYPGYPGFDDKDFKLANEYYQVGAIKTMVKGNIEPYGVFTLGAARYYEKDLSESLWRFSLTAGLGVKILLTERVGIKLEGDFMMPMYFQGVGFYFGSGGSGLTAYSSVPMLQGNFNAGLVFRLGD